jgi:hypothetical protein
MNKRQNKITKKYSKKGGVNNPNISNINNNNGFTATLIKSNVVQQPVKNSNLCKMIIKQGKNTTKKNFMPSQFPKLTGLTQKYVIKSKKVQETEAKEKEKTKEMLEKEILEKARKDVKGLKEQEERQQMYEKAVLQAQKELINNK